jgi:1-acylglycerone phosphate reductase
MAYAVHSATPWYGPYSASKAAVHNLTDTLDMELRPFNIKVLLLALGMVRSNISANTTTAHEFKPAVSYYDQWRENINARLGQGDDVMSAAEFARKTVDAALSPSPPQYLSFGGQASGSWFFSLFPRSLRLSIGWKAYSDKTPKV